MFWLIICLVAFSMAKCDINIQAKTLAAFTREFRAPQPLPIFYNNTKQTKITLTKSMSKKGLAMDWHNELRYSKDFLLIISQDTDLLDGNEKIRI